MSVRMDTNFGFLKPIRLTKSDGNPDRMNPSAPVLKVLSSPDDDPHEGVTPVSEAEWLTLNVGGVLFHTQRTTLDNVPGSLLSELSEKSPYYHAGSCQYWFDRNPTLFQHILDMYRYGELHVPHTFCGPVIKHELDFWRIEETHIAPCCWNSYREYREQEETLSTLGTAFNVVDRFEPTTHKSTFWANVFKWRERIWYTLEDPQYSWPAQIWGFLYVLMIVTSVLTLALDTNVSFRITDKVTLSSSNATVSQLRQVDQCLSRTRSQMDEPIYEEDGEVLNCKKLLMGRTDPHPFLLFIEITLSSVFCVNWIVRFITCPKKIAFLQSALNWIDFLVVLSQFACVGIQNIPNYVETPHIVRTLEAFRLIRICRVFLIFRLAKCYTGLRILLLALSSSIKEMLLLGVIMTVGMMTFSTLIYYAEYNEPQKFPDIPTGFWWAIITMTTVGYGDMYPVTNWGYVVGTLCALTGMLATGLPIPIIANNFTFYYNVSKMKKMQDDRESHSISTEMVGKMQGIFKAGGKVGKKLGGKAMKKASKYTDKVGGNLVERLGAATDKLVTKASTIRRPNGMKGNSTTPETSEYIPEETPESHSETISQSDEERAMTIAGEDYDNYGEPPYCTAAATPGTPTITLNRDSTRLSTRSQRL